MIERKVLLELIEAGLKASFPDNSQAVLFRLGTDGIELRLDPTYLGMFFDANCYASLLGCGGVIENIRLVANTKGLSTDITCYEVTEPDYVVAYIKFKLEEVQSDYLSEAVFSRCTHRGYFLRDKTIEPTIIAEIERVVNGHAGAYVRWFSGQERDCVTQIISKTDRLRYTHKALHNDFASKLRIGKEIENKKDGLAADTLGLERVFNLFLPLLKSWPICKFLNLFGLHYFMAFRGATVPLNNAACVGSLVMRSYDDALEVGRILHRLWMATNMIKGLHFQPFGALPLFMYRMKELQGEGFNRSQKRFLKNEIDKLERLMEIDLEHERVVIFFRIGFAHPPEAFSRRRPLESFIIE